LLQIIKAIKAIIPGTHSIISVTDLTAILNWKWGSNLFLFNLGEEDGMRQTLENAPWIINFYEELSIAGRAKNIAFFLCSLRFVANYCFSFCRMRMLLYCLYCMLVKYFFKFDFLIASQAVKKYPPWKVICLLFG
jgi:hypothetical protein